MDSAQLANSNKTKETEASASINRRDFLATATIALSAATFPAVVTAEEPDKEKPRLKKGDSFPDIKLEGVDGKIIDALKEAKGKVAIVEFWGPWCGPCLAEVPHIKEAAARLEGKEFIDPSTKKSIGKDFAVITVAANFEETIDRWKTIVRDKFPGKLHVGTTQFDTLDTNYGVSGFPTNFVIDGEGTIILKNVDVQSLPALLSKYLQK